MIRSKRWTILAAAVASLIVLGGVGRGSYIEEEFEGPRQVIPVPPGPPRPPPRPPRYPPRAPHHVPELASYLDRLEVGTPVHYRHLAVFPVLLRGPELTGRWLTMDQALARGVLSITEKAGGGSVPHVVVENRSRRDHIFILGGELLSGGKQTRTVRHDLVLAPGQRVEVDVYCVEAHRWSGGERFSESGVLVPQSIQKELRKGTDQGAVWREVERSNRALGTESETGSLEAGLKSKRVQDELAACRRAICPGVSRRAVGFVFAWGHEVLGAELFGRSDLAQALLPKLVDAYAVDVVVQRHHRDRVEPHPEQGIAEAFLDRIYRAGSYRTSTAGAGTGIGTRGHGLVGIGVSLVGEVVHYGCQPEVRLVPVPEPYPPAPRPLPPRRGARPHVE